MTVEEFHRNNHYVPQSYLKNWGDTDGRVWAYRVLVSHSSVPLWKHASVKGLGSHAHLYTRALANELSDEVERWLDANFESPAGTVIQKVVDDVRLTPQDWSHLIRFLAAQDVRTPARLVEMLQRWRQTLPGLLKETLEAAVQKFETSKREGSPLVRSGGCENLEYLPFRISTEFEPGQEQGILRAETVVGRELFLFNLKNLLSKTVHALLAHKWTILRSPEGVEWFTSDDPVIRLNFHNPTMYDFGGGWGSAGTEIFLPLSPRHLLYTKIGEKPPQRGTVVSTEMAGWIQRFTIEHAHRLVIATIPDVNIAALRPRVVDHVAYSEEVERWKNWHNEQTSAAQDLSNSRRVQ